MWKRIGNELAALAAQQKSVAKVILIRQEFMAEKNVVPWQDIVETEFRSRVARLITPTPEINIVSLPAVPPPAPKDYMKHKPYRRLEPDTLNAALRSHGAATLIVSLVGEPTRAPSKGKGWPPIICYSRDGADTLADLIRTGVVVGAVAPRHTNPNEGEKDWFELRYTVVTPDSVAAWRPQGA